MIHLSESTVEELAAKALGIDAILEAGDPNGYIPLLTLLKDVDVSTADLRGAAEWGIYAYLYSQAPYLRKCVRERLAELRKELVTG